MKPDFLYQLEEIGALIQGDHFVYTSGLHGDKYVNKDAVYLSPQRSSEFGRALAHRFKDEKIDAVLAPALGAVILGQWVAYWLEKDFGKSGIKSIFAEKDGNSGFVVKRGYQNHLKNKKLLLVEDIINTGGSIRKVIDLVKNQGAEVVGIAAICNRGEATAGDLGVDNLQSLVDVEFKVWNEKDCPMCKKGIPVNTKLGKGDKK